jgi:kynurenine formamidase
MSSDGNHYVRLDEVVELAERLSNWGRWGPDDQLGTVNHIDADCVRQAAQLVRTGKVISCALPYDQNGPQDGSFGRVNPIHTMLQDGGDTWGQRDLPNIGYADDAVYMPLQAGTQWDALSHIFFRGCMYNGYPRERVTSSGATLNGIEQWTDKIVTRGVLLDIARFRDKEWLEPGEGIDAPTLSACAESVGITVRRGDVLLVRTGNIAQARATGTWGTFCAGPAPGLALSTCEWIADSAIAGIATDTWGMEVVPNETDPAELRQPLHVVLIVHMGLLVGEIFDLDALAADCAGDGVYEFLFVAPPLPFTGAVGSPLNPIAIK